MRRVLIGTAGWGIGPDVRERFGVGATRLERYATRFACVEINSSFYRPHRPATYARWAASVPDGFRFALKVPKEITHARRLVDAIAPLDAFLGESAALGDEARRGARAAAAELCVRRGRRRGVLHGVARALRRRARVRAAARDVVHPRGGCRARAASTSRASRRIRPSCRPPPRRADGSGFAYHRLHGSPRMYYSAYDARALASLAERLRASTEPAWCIFDNTAFGAATANALAAGGAACLNAKRSRPWNRRTSSSR